MIFKDFTTDMNSMTKQRNFFFVLFVGSFAVTVILSIALLSKKKQVVLVPAGFSKEMYLNEASVGSSYLEEMSYFFANHLLDVTPENFSYRKAMVLRHVAASAYQKVQKHLDTEEKRYKEYNLSTTFAAQEIKVVPEKLEAEVTGVLYSWFGKDGTKQEKVKFVVRFDYSGGVMLLKDFGTVTREVLGG